MDQTNENYVFIKTHELGEAITSSSIYTAMRETEARVRENAEASEALARYAAHKAALESLFRADDPDPDAIRLHTESMQSMQSELNDMPIVAEMNEARREFSKLIRQVNQVLGFIVSGETDITSCGGSCEGCAGCGAR
ncbi:MAG: YlbF family regulator [Oscillospiraceae bacterium]|jgi:cell fate (sporulation/competence/biofilm development) regulator YlbF (YheA/YmcA/DUF963 family)|nr:YlbF family regulator [Oscillospiraceae bacterium]